jgi:hypothetical protein
MLVNPGLPEVGRQYTRHELARLWRHKSYHAMGRGVFLPRGECIILLSITGQKASWMTQYDDSFDGSTLHMDGEANHAHSERLAASGDSREEVHLFFGEQPRHPFTYHGRVRLVDYRQMTGDSPSRFTFRTV